MKNVQISEELFFMLLRFHFLGEDLWREEIETQLQQKLDAMTNRNLYTKYKTAPTHEEQETARSLCKTLKRLPTRENERRSLHGEQT